MTRDDEKQMKLATLIKEVITKAMQEPPLTHDQLCSKLYYSSIELDGMNPTELKELKSFLVDLMAILANYTVEEG